MMRTSLAGAIAALAAATMATTAQPKPSHQATGVKVGEVMPDSAIVWVRLTAAATRNNDGLVPGSAKWEQAYLAGLTDEERRRYKPKSDTEAGTAEKPAWKWPAWIAPNQLEGSCPGAPGRVRVRYSPSADLADAVETAWAEVGPESDFTHQFRLKGLKPDTVYHYETQTAPPEGLPHGGSLRGRFRTAPAPDRNAPVRFVVITGQNYDRTDQPPNDRTASGDYQAYESMLALEPDFIVPTGDTVYYDSGHRGGFAFNQAMARHHWHRVYSLPNLVRFHLRVPGYWEKDDHDTVKNDSWPGATLGDLSWAQGLAVFREQVPMGGKTFRTVRWGRALQVWLVEGRDFRSPNNAADGPAKTIWGPEQKAWLKKTLLESDATWRVLVSPTPLVGPDRGPRSKADNHANLAFQHEGDEMRAWFRDHVARNFFLVCGDRHWQYHSVHPETGLHEFSCGPLTDRHAGGSPGENAQYHRYHKVQGGFLSVTVEPKGDAASRIVFRHHTAAGPIAHEAAWTAN